MAVLEFRFGFGGVTGFAQTIFKMSTFQKMREISGGWIPECFVDTL